MAEGHESSSQVAKRRAVGGVWGGSVPLPGMGVKLIEQGLTSPPTQYRLYGRRDGGQVLSPQEEI